NSWRGGEGSADRLLSLLREIDVGEATNPDIDRALDYLPPSAREMARFTFAQRGDRDSQLLDAMHRELPRDSAISSAPRRVADHREYVAMLRRRQFFERRDEGWKEMLPDRTADEFWELVGGLRSSEMLARLADGSRPRLVELRRDCRSLGVFKDVRASAPYQGVMVTRWGHDFYRSRRESAGTLFLEPLEGGAS